MSAASGGNSEPKQGQRSQSARGFCPRSTMRVPQPDIIEHFGNADAVPQPPERCLSRKAGIVRCCLNCGLQKRAPHAVRHLFVAVIVSIISYASRVSTDILTNIMQASLRCCSRIFSAAFFFPSFFTSSRHSRSHTFILTYYPKMYLKSKNAGYFHFSAAP